MFKNSQKKLIISLSLPIIFAIGLIFFPVINTQAQGTYNFTADSGLGSAGAQAGFDTGSPTSLEGIISAVIYTFLSLAGILFLGLIVYGGFIWMTAQGNEEQVKKAKNIVINSLIGLTIALAAYVISYFLISYFGNNYGQTS